MLIAARFDTERCIPDSLRDAGRRCLLQHSGHGSAIAANARRGGAYPRRHRGGPRGVAGADAAFANASLAFVVRGAPCVRDNLDRLSAACGRKPGAAASYACVSFMVDAVGMAVAPSLRDAGSRVSRVARVYQEEL